MHGDGAVAHPVAHGHRQRARAGLVHPLAQHLVSGEHQYRHPVVGGGQAVNHQLGGGFLVDFHVIVLQVHGMAQGAAVPAGGGMIAGEHHALIALINAAHHAPGVTSPAAKNFDVLRQQLRLQVARRIVGIPDKDVRHALRSQPFTGRGHFPGHLLLKAGIVPLVRQGFVPVRNAARSLDIRGKKHLFHSSLPPFVVPSSISAVAHCNATPGSRHASSTTKVPVCSAVPTPLPRS